MNSKVYLVDLEKQTHPITLPHNGLGLFHHKIIYTGKTDEKEKNSLKVEGLLCFGGKNDAGEINPHVYYLAVENKQNEFCEKLGKSEWNIL